MDFGTQRRTVVTVGRVSNPNACPFYITLLKDHHMHYLFLAIAIVAEVIGTTFMKMSDGFTRLMPSVATALAYAIAFYCLSLTLKAVPTGMAYAIWSGVGIVLIAAVAWIVQGQKLDLAAMLGMGLILSGVVVMNLFSKVGGH